jgi:hypothetical protein
MPMSTVLFLRYRAEMMLACQEREHCYGVDAEEVTMARRMSWSILVLWSLIGCGAMSAVYMACPGFLPELGQKAFVIVGWPADMVYSGICGLFDVVPESTTGLLLCGMVFGATLGLAVASGITRWVRHKQRKGNAQCSETAADALVSPGPWTYGCLGSVALLVGFSAAMLLATSVPGDSSHLQDAAIWILTTSAVPIGPIITAIQHACGTGGEDNLVIWYNSMIVYSTLVGFGIGYGAARFISWRRARHSRAENRSKE